MTSKTSKVIIITTIIILILYQFGSDVQSFYEYNSFTAKLEYQKFQKNHPYHPNYNISKTSHKTEVEADKPDLAFQHEFIKTMDPVTKTIPRDALVKANEAAELSRQTEATSISWEERGPLQVGGRTRAIMIDPNDVTGNKLWAGSVSGGLWYTNDITAEFPIWLRVDDFWENIAVSSICYDPTNTMNFYAGTGEGWGNYDLVVGAGIWKSIDGGVTWLRLPSTAVNDFDFVQKIIVHPITGDVYACTYRSGLMRSTDNGANWDEVLSTTTVPTASNSNRAADIEIGSDNTIWVAMGIWEADGIYSSTTGNYGDWTAKNTGLAPNRTRIDIAIAPSDVNIMYAALQDTTKGLQGLYKTTDAGLSWEVISTPMIDESTPFTANQAWYDLILCVHPTNPNRLIAGGRSLFKSTNGGSSWDQIYYIHSDHHKILFKPGSDKEVFFANDGGVYYTDDVWKILPGIWDKNRGYRVTQFYSCAIHPVSGVDYFIGGTQDNGSIKFSSPGLNETVYAHGGDGGYCFINQLSPRFQFASYTNNNFYRSTDYGDNFTPITSDNSGRFISPADYDSDADILFAARDTSSIKRIRYASGDYWEDSIYDLNIGDIASAIKVSPYTENRIYVGVNGGRVFKIDFAEGVNWQETEITGAALPAGYINCIEVGSSDDELLLVYSNYGISSVWHTTDHGVNWTDKEGDLPNMPIRWALFNPLDRREVLLATDVGVWSTEDITAASPNWVASNDGLANVRTDMLKLRPSDNLVLAATHGRGMFTSTSFQSTKGVKVLADDPATDDRLGNSVAVSGNYSIVGARAKSGGGAAYIFVRIDSENWEQYQKLAPSNLTPGDAFGQDVAIFGDYAVIGALYDNDNGDEAGAAYVFKNNSGTWEEQEKLVASDGEAGDRFGGRVAIAGDFICVGAPGDDDVADNAGAAYVFKRNGEDWEEVDKLKGYDSEAGDSFGQVAMQDSLIIIGAPNSSIFGGIKHGTVYTFELEGNTWNDKQQLFPTEGADGDMFGYSLSTHGGFAIIGSMGNDENHNNSGAAYVYVQGAGVWNLMDKLSSVDAHEQKNFGNAVSIYNNYALIGASGDWENGIGSGSSYIYKFNGTQFVNQNKIIPSDGQRNDIFGHAVALSGDAAVITAPGDDQNFADNTGSVYFYSNFSNPNELSQLSVNPQERNVSSSSGQVSFYVSNVGTGTMSWISSTEYDWLNIIEGTSGLNSGTIRIDFGSNDCCAREAEIIVSAPGAVNSPKILKIYQQAGSDTIETKITANIMAGYDRFGWAVAVDGNYVVVGSYSHNGSATQDGAAYVFEKVGCDWNQTAKLTSSEHDDYNLFGDAVDISGDNIIIGSPGNISAYIFTKPESGWNDMTETAKLTGSNYQGRFGSAVAITSQSAIVGAWESNAAFIYDKSGSEWNSMTESVLIIPENWGYFGSSVDISGPFAVIGAPIDDNSIGMQTGAAYIYHKDYFWSFQQKIESDDGAQSDNYGISIAVEGSRIVVGASQKRAAYVYERDAGIWTQTAKLEPWNLSNHNRFGVDVDIKKNNIVVGAYLDREIGEDAGAAYTFRYDGSIWQPIQKILPNDGAEADLFGKSISITDDHFIVGAYGDQDSGNYTGSAYLFCNYSELEVGVQENEFIPHEYILFQNYPNPFNPSTNIKFALKDAGNAKIEIYDILGRRVSSLINKTLPAGFHTYIFNAAHLSSGVYFYKLNVDKEFTDVKKMLLVK